MYSLPAIVSRTGSGAVGAFVRLGGAGAAVSSALPAAATALGVLGAGETSNAGLTALVGGAVGGAVALVRSAEGLGDTGVAAAAALLLTGALAETWAGVPAEFLAGLVAGLLAELFPTRWLGY